MKHIILIALFMIALVLSITFSSTLTLAAIPDKYEYAGNIASVKVYDPVNNLHPVIQAGEQGQMEVLIREPSVDPLGLTFETVPFNNCEPAAADQSKCFLAFSPATCGGYLKYKTLELPISFVIDGLRPAVDSIDVDSNVEIDGKKVIGDNDLVLRYYNLRDEAECGGCAGIKELKVYENSFAQNNIVGTVQFGRDSITDCNKGDGTVTVPISNLAPAGAAQEKELFVQVCDYLGQCSEDVVSVTVIVDRKKPDVETELLLENDQPATYFQSGLRYKIKAAITDDSSIDLGTLSLDISQFSPESAPTPIISNNTITWTFTAQSSSAPSYYEISIEDGAGNLQVHRETVNLQADNNAPQVHDIRTSNSYMGINYISTVTDIIIEVADDVSGIDPSTITFDLSQIDPQYTTTEHPDFCNETGSMTVCKYQNLQTTKTTGTAQFSAQVSDRAGNTASPRTEQIIIDRVAPAGTVVSQTLNLPTAADEGNFGFRISAVDDNPIIVTADLSEFSDDHVLNVSCQDSQNCIMTPADLNPVWGDFVINFNISDIAGNSVQKDYQLKLYELAQCNLQGDGLVSVSVGDSIPEKLDRRLASSQTAARLFFPMTVTHSDTVKASDYTIVGCKDIQGAMLGNYQVIAQNTDTPFLVLSAAIGTGQTPADIPIECNLSVQVAHNGVKCDQPEMESFSKTIELYNDALGDLGNAATDKIDTITKRINKIDRRIDSKKKGLQYLEYWCDIAYGIHIADIAIETIKSVVWAVMCVLENIVYTRGVAKEIWENLCKLINQFWGDAVLTKLFWSKHYLPIGDGAEEILGIMSKYICMVLSCRLCNIEDIIAVTMGAVGEISQYGANSDYSQTEEKTDEARDSYEGRLHDEENARYSSERSDIDDKYTEPYRAAQTEGEREEIINDWVAEHNAARVRHSERRTRLESEYMRSEDYSSYNLNRLHENYYYRFGSDVNRGKTDFWQDMGRATTYQATFDDTFVESEFTWDPFRSIHYAEACVCHRGMVYNWKKEKEITCAYRNCVKKHMLLGLPASSCDDMYREQECLYVDSAEYKLHGFNFWENFIEAAIETVIYYAANKVFEAICGPYYTEEDKCTQQVCAEGWMVAICSVLEAAINVAEFVEVVDKGFDQFAQRDLDEFYCSNENAVPVTSEMDWYPVEDWELEVCSTWGGSGVEEGYAHGSYASTGSSLQSTTVTIQAQKTMYPDSSAQIYEIAWYVEPKEETIQYNIIMQGKTDTKQIAQGSAAVNSPGSDYYSEELAAEYDKVMLTVPGNQIVVPVKCVNCVE
ncbi:hypothetical protein GF371_05115 [Candidatus Woesearchaeota archaeon]|nr:hypothetical protein [Candidatus Woesearchaeota archaeon]